MWVDRYSPTAGGATGQRWDGFKIDITKPDGTKETIGPFKCGSDVGTDARQYTPDQVGTYTIVFSWPGQTVANSTGLPRPHGIAYSAIILKAPQANRRHLIVQQEPIKDWQEPPLPTGYWTSADKCREQRLVNRLQATG